MTTVILVILAGTLLIALGLYLIYAGIRAGSELSFLNLTFRSTNVGVAAALVGAAMMVMLNGRVDKAENEGDEMFADTGIRGASGLHGGDVSQEKETQATRIVIKLPPELRQPTLDFGLLHVRDGKDEVADSGPLLNKEIPFTQIDRLGSMEAVVESVVPLGFQFKCYVDHSGLEFEKVKELLETAGFGHVSKGAGKPFRAWFIVPEYPTYQTVDGMLNNFFYPS